MKYITLINLCCCLGTFAIEALSTGTENRLGACIATTSGDDNAKMILVGCNDTDPKQKWTYTLKGSLIVCNVFFAVVKNNFCEQRI